MSPGKRFSIRCWLALVLYALSITTAPADTPNPPDELVFLTWSDYIDPDLVQEFERRFHAKVTQVYFEADDIRSDMLVESGGSGYDVVMVNGVEVAPYVRRGWLAALDPAQIPNLKHLHARWAGAFQDAPQYGVPYFWGTIGIGYRRDLVPTPVTSWLDLFRPSEALRGKVVMIKNARDTYGMALKALGYSVNSENSEELTEAENLLTTQRPFVKVYSYVSLTKDSALVTGEVAMSMMYNGDALALKEFSDDIDYVVPGEGTQVWVDYLTVSASSSHKKLAQRFINFLNEPHNAARNAEFVHYATPNRAAEKYLPDEYFKDHIIYPPQSVLDRAESYRELSPRTLKRRNEHFVRLIR